ncbi:heme-containing dehydratase domain-containing protein [Sarocladium implicatum]|nr:heme-containing dehydratase domain-containing protein [Sarocladium implicatum]
MTDGERFYPLKWPQDYKPPVPRWQLVLPSDLSHVFIAYVGIQCHGDGAEAEGTAKVEMEKAIESWLSSTNGDEPAAVESFKCIRGHDRPDATVWVCYWNNKDDFDRCLERLCLTRLHARLDDDIRPGIGVWCEAFESAVSRLETNYTGTDYLPGLARLPGARAEEHTLTAYWGAARDRIPDSTFDRFEAPSQNSVPSITPNGGIAQRLTGSNPENLVHIRSGQYWEDCDADEVQAYETKLEPTLELGLQYLWDNPEETGAMGLRYLRNEAEPSGRSSKPPRKETCVTGFFTSLDRLEKWAQTHRSHLKIYHGAMNHAKVFGKERRFRTWHEVSVLEANAAKFEYVNCSRGTGVMGLLPLDNESSS